MRLSCTMALAGVILAASAPAWAADYAAQVINYSSGSTYPHPAPTDPVVDHPGQVDASVTNAAGALGGLTADTGFGALTPFNGVFDPSQYVGIGQGGSLELQFAQPVKTSGFTIGVHTGVGLIDMDYPNGSTVGGAIAYSTPRVATVDVSKDGTNWVTLGSHAFDNPSNYYSSGITTPGYQAVTSGLIAADPSLPFTGSLSDLSGQTWSGMLSVFNGSTGGTWLDLSSAGLSQVDYIRFTVDTGNVMYVDSVVGLAVPEPASLGVLGLGAAALLARRRR